MLDVTVHKSRRERQPREIGAATTGTSAASTAPSTWRCCRRRSWTAWRSTPARTAPSGRTSSSAVLRARPHAHRAGRGLPGEEGRAAPEGPARARGRRRHARGSLPGDRRVDGGDAAPVLAPRVARRGRPAVARRERALRLPHLRGPGRRRAVPQRTAHRAEGHEPPLVLAEDGPLADAAGQPGGRAPHQEHEHERRADVALSAGPPTSSTPATSSASTCSTSWRAGRPPTTRPPDGGSRAR